MPVDSEHPEYTARYSQWTRCADVIEGTDAVKGAEDKYLPLLEGQTAGGLPSQTSGYGAYLMRALFYNATARTIDGLAGLIFRKDSHIELPITDTDKKLLLDDITQTGVTFDSFSKRVIRKLLGMGRCGILVDRAEEASAQTTSPPFLQMYDARDIVNWQSKRIGNKVTLCRVVLYEQATIINPDDPFMPSTVDQFRELYLDDETGFYNVNIWQEEKVGEKDNETAWVVQSNIVPTNRGQFFTYIPFVMMNMTSMALSCEKPPLLDLVDVNLSHYRSSADLEHARHYTALPTPWVAGFDTSNELKIGSGTAWVSDNPNATAGILEFTGSGLSECRNALDDKQKMMAVLGARLLEEQMRAVEASDTIKTRLSGEQSIMRSMANTASEGFELAFNWLLLWMGLSPEAVIELNTDFIDTKMAPAEQASTMLLLQSGAISFDTFYYLMERGEMTRPGITVDVEKALIEKERILRVDEEESLMIGHQPAAKTPAAAAPAPVAIPLDGTPSEANH